jgi:hypothetical protein
VQDTGSESDSRAGIPVRRTPGRWMLCGWGCGGWLTSHVMRAHFTKCPNRPAVVPQVNRVDRRGKNSKAKRGRPPGRRMPCGWRCGAELTSRLAACGRISLTARGGRGFEGQKCEPGRARRCRQMSRPANRPTPAWGIYVPDPSRFLKNRTPYRAWGTSHVMRALFTRCPNRPAALPQVNSSDRRGKNSNAKRGRPPGRRMPCGWRCGSRLTASQMRAHFTICPKRLGGSRPRGPTREELERQARTPGGTTNAVRLALRVQTHGERHAVAFR